MSQNKKGLIELGWFGEMPDPGGPDTSKPYHYAKMINEKGQVSLLCASRPRAINLKRAWWTTRPGAVTCVRCLNKLRERCAVRRVLESKK